jgi:hypothetical protein
MVKHIHRTARSEDDRYNRNTSSEEWSHITAELKQQGPSDPMSPKERIIAFSNRFNQNQTKEDTVKEKSAQLKDQFGNTDQYFKFVNGMIKDKVEKIKQIKQDEKKFLGELDLLQNKIKTRYELEKLNPKHVTIENVRNLLSVLEEECEKMKDKLLYQELIVQRTKDEIAKKRQQINNVKVEIKTTRPEISDPLLLLKEELRRAGIPDTDKIFQLLKQIANRMNS